MTDLETVMGGVQVRGGQVSPEDIARYVVAFQDDYATMYQGFPEMSPEGIRLLSRIGQTPEELQLKEKLLSGGTQVINERTEADLRRQKDERGSLIHTTWRLTRQVRNYAQQSAVAQVEPLSKSFVLIDDDPCTPWTSIESAFRFGAGLILSKIVSSELEVHIPAPTPVEPKVALQYGHLLVENHGMFRSDGTLVHTDYTFSTAS